jgi:hypothetical protein
MHVYSFRSETSRDVIDVGSECMTKVNGLTQEDVDAARQGRIDIECAERESVSAKERKDRRDAREAADKKARAATSKANHKAFAAIIAILTKLLAESKSDFVQSWGAHRLHLLVDGIQLGLVTDDVERIRIMGREHAVPNGIFGAPGKREKKLELTYLRSIDFPGYAYNSTCYVHFFAHADGIAKWKTNNILAKYNDRFDVSDSWEVGETRTVAATVKEHSEYQGRRQTAITRVKW